jgi:hypothetical protein
MGVRTRGLDIKAGAAKLKADKAARLEAELVVDRWNRRLASGRDMLWCPTIRAALVAGTPWLEVFCPGCGTITDDDRIGVEPCDSNEWHEQAKKNKPMVEWRRQMATTADKAADQGAEI